MAAPSCKTAGLNKPPIGHKTFFLFHFSSSTVPYLTLITQLTSATADNKAKYEKQSSFQSRISSSRNSNPINKKKFNEKAAKRESTKTIKLLMSNYSLASSCQFQHQAAREYYFFPSVHHSYSCIDFFLISNSTLCDTKIHPIVCHHAPVTQRTQHQMAL